MSNYSAMMYTAYSVDGECAVKEYSTQAGEFPWRSQHHGLMGGLAGVEGPESKAQSRESKFGWQAVTRTDHQPAKG